MPVIAEFFTVSIDALMNFNIMETNNTLGGIRSVLSQYVSASDFVNGLKVADDAVKNYPNDFLILMYTANLLYNRGASGSSTSEEQDLLDSISYYEMTIKLCKDTITGKALC